MYVITFLFIPTTLATISPMHNNKPPLPQAASEALIASISTFPHFTKEEVIASTPCTNEAWRNYVHARNSEQKKKIKKNKSDELQGLEKQKTKKSEQLKKELDKGSDKGKESKEENSKKLSLLENSINISFLKPAMFLSFKSLKEGINSLIDCFKYSRCILKHNTE